MTVPTTILCHKMVEGSFPLTPLVNRSQSKKKAFTKSCTKWADDLGRKEIEKELGQMKKYCTTVRLIVHTQMKILRRRYEHWLRDSLMS